MRVSAVPSLLVSLLCLGLLGVSCGSDEAPAGNAENAGFLRESGAVQAAESDAAGTLRPALDEPPSAVPPLAEAGGGAADVAVAQVRDAAALEQQAAAWIESREPARAARQLSELLFEQLARPEQERAAIGRLVVLLRRAQAGHRWDAKGAWPSFDVKVQSGDSLIAIRKRVLAAHPELLLCTGLIARTNQLRSETAIKPEQLLRIPTDRAACVVDLSAMWTFFTLGGEIADAWEVGVGKDGSETKPGVYTIGLKQQNPMWSPAGRDPVPFGDPANPLGTRWLAWHLDGRGTTLGFHGTNDPMSLGRKVSEGCIRMRNEDVELLFEILPQGAEVRVQP